MFGLFGSKKKAKEKHEQELKERLASRLVNYEASNDNEKSKFANVDFDEDSKAITLLEFTKTAWAEWARENPSQIGVFSEKYEVKA